MSQLYETCVGRLGSRFSLNFRPRDQGVWHSAVGRFYDERMDLAVGLRYQGDVRCLPFTRKLPAYEIVEQSLTLTTLTYEARSRHQGTAIKVVFTAPFYPKDVRLSTAPFFYIDIYAKRHRHPDAPSPEDSQAELVFVLERSGSTFVWNGGSGVLTYVAPMDGKQDHSYLRRKREQAIGNVPCRELVVAGERLTGKRFELTDEFTLVASLVWAAHVDMPVLSVRGQRTSFRYLKEFASAEDVAHYARAHREEILAKCALVDSLIAEATLTKPKRDLISFAFQSYLTNTWWTTFPDGRDWFSVWEGVCQFHSTVDVEYNLAWIYLLLWPELLEMTFTEWRDHLKDGWLSHDMGQSTVVDGQSYPHEMEIEENCNFVLLAHALWRFTGKEAIVRENFATVRQMIQFNWDADTHGNGFPDRGVANTIDDASPAVQYSREQVYLAVKTYAAYRAAELMAAHLGEDNQFTSLCREGQKRIAATLEKDAWLGDHYAVCLDRTTAGLVVPWTGEPLPEGPLVGWDAYHIYSANGLLLLLATGTQFDLPLEPFRQDILSSTCQAMMEYGCYHSSTDHSQLWVSQNLWRDYVAAYLGIDQLDLAERYWAFEHFENSAGRGGCFVDTYGWNFLSYYPRGITVLGILYALGGVQIDRVEGFVRLAPARLPVRIPLPTFADWENKKVPWVDLYYSEGNLAMGIINPEYVKGLKLELLTQQARAIPGPT